MNPLSHFFERESGDLRVDPDFGEERTRTFLFLKELIFSVRLEKGNRRGDQAL